MRWALSLPSFVFDAPCLWACSVFNFTTNRLPPCQTPAALQGLCIGYSKWRGESPSVSTRSMLGGAAALLVTSGTMPLENLVRDTWRAVPLAAQLLACMPPDVAHAADLSTASRASTKALPHAGVPPLQVRRMQVQGREVGGKPAPRYASTLDCARLMLAKEGIGSFWRGTFSSFAKIGPSIAATRLLYETVVDVRGIGGVRRYRHAA